MIHKAGSLQVENPLEIATIEGIQTLANSREKNTEESGSISSKIFKSSLFDVNPSQHSSVLKVKPKIK